MLSLQRPVRDAMIAHALRGLPNEACGVFLAPADGDEVHRFVPMANTAASSELYQLDGKELLEVERRADADGTRIVGVMHSHTHTTAYPSPTDVRDAGAFDPFGGWHYVIVSLRDAEPVLRSYRIIDGEITEETVLVVEVDRPPDSKSR